jgi:signal transduction histidine kinase
MDDQALKLLQARRVIDAERRERVRLERELKQARLDLTRAQRIIVALQRQQARPREETAHAAGAGSATQASS